MSAEVIVGIDLGTTFSAIAYVNPHGKPEVIPNREGERTTPSVIFFEDGGRPIVGREARNQAIIEPARTVRFVKREMGNASFRFHAAEMEYFPEDLSAMILKKLKVDAEAALGTNINKAVISVPAYFRDAQREATRQAGQIAGLEVTRVVNEPTAAAIAYGLDRAEADQTVLVYDFGGGTFDVTIMRMKGRHFTILATDGNDKLGGKDIDGRLVNYLAEEFQRAQGIDPRSEPHAHQDLWDKAEIAKKDLSFRENVSVVLSAGGRSLRVDLERSLLNELIDDLVSETEECMKRVIQAANLTWPQIDSILLAGGSSRIPAVRQLIARVSGKEAAKDMNPDECVALGAAALGVVEATEGATPVAGNVLNGGPLVVSDVAAHSLGVKALAPDHARYLNSIIIPRFTSLPAERTRLYTTKDDNQGRVEITILQGEEDDPGSPAVERVGSVDLGDLPPHKAGELNIEVTLRYTADGIIEVKAKEMRHGKAIREVVMAKAGVLAADIVHERRELLDGTDV